MSQLAEITLHLQSANEILPFPDAALYRKRILSKYVEEFIKEEALTCPRHSTIILLIHLPLGEAVRTDEIVDTAHQHFAYRRAQSQRKLKHSSQYGWRSLLTAPEAACLFHF